MPKLLRAISGLSVVFSRLMVLGDFILPSLGQMSEAAQEFMASMIVLGLFQVILGLTGDNGLTLDFIFLSEQ